MTDLAPDIAHHAALDARMVAASKDVRLLALVSWPAGHEAAFLADYARGVVKLPQIQYPSLDFSATRAEMEAIASAADPDHPLGQYLMESARSWSQAAELCESLGTPAV